MGGSQAFIDAGYEYEISELIKSIIIASANDAAVAIAEHVSGSEDSFVAKMNKKAQELDMKNTVFKNCTGLPESGHHSSARDVAIMSKELLKYDEYFKWSTVWMDEIKHQKDGRVTELVNTNKLIRSLQGCDGLKTGYTNEAGFCVTTTAKRGELRLISVILGGNSSKERFDEAAMLINFGFANYENKEVVKKDESLGQVKLNGGKEKSINLIASESFSVCVKNDEASTIETRIEIPESIDAPIANKQEAGHLIILLNGQEIGKISLLADKDYEKAGFFERLKGIVSFWK
jgi:D-alanyl-D-alanine carboxypeptidase (penicillin-binding protein 5/6)